MAFSEHVRPVILIVILAIIVGFVATFSSSFPYTDKIKTTENFPGSLTIFFQETWTTPFGEYVRGLVEYTPATDKVVQLLSPDVLSGQSILPYTISPDGGEVMAVGRKSLKPDAGPVLGSISFSKQKLVRTFMTYDSGAFTNPVWSPDAGRIAFAVVGSKNSPGPLLYILPMFKGQPGYGQGIPLAFSPDGLSLLIEEPLNLAIVDSVTRGRSPVKGMEDTTAVDRFIAYPGAEDIATINKNGTISIFVIDWEEKSVKPAGSIDLKATSGSLQGVFNNEGEFFVYKAGEIRVYNKKAGTYTESGRYKVAIPAQARLIRFNNK